MPNSTTPIHTPHSRKSSVIGICTALVLTAIISGLLHARVAFTGEPSPRTPLTVETVAFEQHESYQRKMSYLGLVVAGTRANLGFEIAGQIASLPVRQGSAVAAGDVIARLDDSALQARRAATAADLERALAELELAQLKSERQADLTASGVGSKEAWDETRLRARALEAQVSAVRAQLRSIDIDLDKSRLRAPYDGLIADHYLHQGAIVSPGMPVVRLIETGALEAHVGVAVQRSRSLVPGDVYALTLRGQPFQGELLSVRPDVDPVTRSTTAVFVIPPGVDALDGEPVTLQMPESVPLQGGWLPIAALLEGQRGMWNVLRIDSAGQSHRTVRETVEVLDIQGERAYVRGTLENGALVVASGVHRMTPGAVVALAESH